MSSLKKTKTAKPQAAKPQLSPKYLATKRYRAKYPKRRAAERERNYAQTAGPSLNRNHRARWTIWELKVLENWGDLVTDRTLHKWLGRSVQASQNKRHLLRQTAKTQKALRTRKEVSLES